MVGVRYIGGVHPEPSSEFKGDPEGHDAKATL